MTLQQKFLLVVSMLGLALLGSLGAVWWAFGLLQRELATPFSETAGVLDALREIKRTAEEEARIVYTDGLAAPNQEPTTATPQESPGIRGPRGEPKPFVPSASQIGAFRQFQQQADQVLKRIDRSEVFVARIGVSTWRNLKFRVESVGKLGEDWFREAQSGTAPESRSQAETGAACYNIHELVEKTEKQILDTAKTAIGYGDTIRSKLFAWLLSVIAVGLLGSVLAVALLRRWVQKPVSVLREAAARIAQGDLQYRVPVLQRDELGLLSAEVNHMAQMVQVMQDERIEHERLAAIGEMVRRIVHNVRNPLAGIRGLAEVTRLDFDKGSPNRENMDLIVATVDTFERWLTELLDATSPTSIQPREMGVGDWITGIVEVHRSQAAARNVSLLLDAAGAPDVAVFDPKHMDHAVSALVSNAIEATPEGGSVWVTARRPHENGVWELEVVDNGRGVPPDVLPRIFDAHFTTKRHGSGLGLAMAQQIVKGHAGRIVVRNGDEAHPDRCGACFTITLPVRAPEPEGEPNIDRSAR